MGAWHRRRHGAGVAVTAVTVSTWPRCWRRCRGGSVVVVAALAWPWGCSVGIIAVLAWPWGRGNVVVVVLAWPGDGVDVAAVLAWP